MAAKKSTFKTVQKIPANLTQVLPDRLHPITGTAILALMRNLAKARYDFDADERGSIALDAMEQVAKTLTLVPPSTPEEALAAACIMYAEAEEIDSKKIAGSDDNEDAWLLSTMMKRRAIALAAWIETAHGIDRKDYGLDFFCDSNKEGDLLPHSAPHPMSRPCVAPLRAGVNSRLEAAG